MLGLFEGLLSTTGGFLLILHSLSIQVQVVCMLGLFEGLYSTTGSVLLRLHSIAIYRSKYVRLI